MKLLPSAAILASATVVLAHGPQHVHHARQAAPPASGAVSSATGAATGAASSATTGPSSVAGVTSAPPATSTTTFTFSLFSTNPTAVPLASIISNAPSQATQPLDTTYAPGATPTFLPSAPALPNGQRFYLCVKITHLTLFQPHSLRHPTIQV